MNLQSVDFEALIGVLVVSLFLLVVFLYLEVLDKQRIIKERAPFIEALGNSRFVSVGTAHGRLQRSGRKESLKEVTRIYKVLQRAGYVNGGWHKVMRNYIFEKRVTVPIHE